MQLQVNLKAILSLIVFSLIATKNSYACPIPNKVFVIGVEAIEYSPHYNFVQPEQANFFGDFVTWLSQKTQCQFQVKSLPIKRLKLAYEKTGNIDFIYPDNPSWRDGNPVPRFFSDKIITALGGTMVKESNVNITIENFHSLAFPRGFSPVAWYPLQEKYDIHFSETINALTALKMVDTQRVDGADVEYNVAHFLMEKGFVHHLALAKNLPFTPTTFHLSTFKEQALMLYINDVIRQNKEEIHKLKQRLNIIEQLPKS